MARPIKEGFDKFPKWRPMRATLKKMMSCDKSVRYRSARHSSDAFIKRKEVRSFIFDRDGHACQFCGSTCNLTIDHIISVYAFSVGKIPVERLNDEDNLTTLCNRCNAGKEP